MNLVFSRPIEPLRHKSKLPFESGAPQGQYHFWGLIFNLALREHSLKRAVPVRGSSMLRKDLFHFAIVLRKAKSIHPKRSQEIT